MMRRKRQQKRPAARRKGGTFGDMTVAQIMEKRVQTARPEAKADRVAAMMLKGFGAVPILSKTKQLMGIVSEHDLLASLDDGRQWRSLAAKDIMSMNPYSVPPETTLGTLIHVLKESDLIRVPVVNAQNKVIGIVARRDVVKAALRYAATAAR
jgi:CBS domain-containing protein